MLCTIEYLQAQTVQAENSQDIQINPSTSSQSEEVRCCVIFYSLSAMDGRD